MPILGCSSIEEAFALQQAEEARAGRRGEFYDFIRSIPMVPVSKTTLRSEEFWAMTSPMSQVKMLVHQIMTRPGMNVIIP